MRAGGPFEITVLTASAFFWPSLTLSTVTPIVVKLRLRSLDQTGRVVGELSALGTLGALAGTFLTGFVLLAAVPSRSLVLIVGVALVVVGLPLLLRSASKGVSALALVATAGAGGGLFIEGGPCDVETTYFCATIEVDPANEGGRTLWLDTLRHSYVDLDDPEHLEFRYSRIMADVIAELPEGPLRGAYVGGGGFTLPRYFAAVRPGTTALVFEIDGELVGLVEDELGLVLSADLRVEVGDARLALPDQPDGAFDFVVGDAFGGLSVPWHLTTREFLREIDRVLDEDGVYVINLIDYPPLGFARAEAATFLEVFDHVGIASTFDRLTGADGGNFVLIGSRTELDWASIGARILDRGGFDAVLAGAEAAAFADGARVLRDDFAPVDQLLSQPPR